MGDEPLIAGVIAAALTGFGTWIASRAAYRQQSVKSAADQVQSIWAVEASEREKFRQERSALIEQQRHIIDTLLADRSDLHHKMAACREELIAERLKVTQLLSRISVAEK